MTSRALRPDVSEVSVTLYSSARFHLHLKVGSWVALGFRSLDLPRVSESCGYLGFLVLVSFGHFLPLVPLMSLFRGQCLNSSGARTFTSVSPTQVLPAFQASERARLCSEHLGRGRFLRRLFQRKANRIGGVPSFKTPPGPSNYPLKCVIALRSWGDVHFCMGSLRVTFLPSALWGFLHHSPAKRVMSGSKSARWKTSKSDIYHWVLHPQEVTKRRCMVFESL